MNNYVRISVGFLILALAGIGIYFYLPHSSEPKAIVSNTSSQNGADQGNSGPYVNCGDTQNEVTVSTATIKDLLLKATGATKDTLFIRYSTQNEPQYRFNTNVSLPIKGHTGLVTKWEAISDGIDITKTYLVNLNTGATSTIPFPPRGTPVYFDKNLPAYLPYFLSPNGNCIGYLGRTDSYKPADNQWTQTLDIFNINKHTWYEVKEWKNVSVSTQNDFPIWSVDSQNLSFTNQVGQGETVELK